MDVAIVIPGIMGTRLHLPDAASGAGKEVWPPTPGEVVRGYRRIDDLQRDDLVVGDLIDNVLCYDFYNLIDRHMRTLGYYMGGAERRQVNFAYDWRRDNFDTAGLLAAEIARQHQDGAKTIYLLAHSMGGLIARLLLESGSYDAEPWFGKIALLATFGTPHIGAPLALGRILGLDGASGISKADFRRLSQNEKYPSGYQLIPAPGEAAIWNVKGTSIVEMDPYDPATATDLGLKPVLVERARAVHDILGAGRHPVHVKYFYFAGSGHQTATRVNVFHTSGQAVDHGKSVITRTDAAGDGTVPMFSALPARGFRHVAVNKHETVFKGQPFRKVLHRLFGSDAGNPFERLDDEALFDDIYLELSLDRPVYEKGEVPELIVTVLDPYDENGVTDAIDGKLVIEKLNEKGVAALVREFQVQLASAPVSSMRFSLQEPSAPGLYRVSFVGSPKMADAVPFAIQDG